MLPYPNIDPVALDLGFLQIHWYGLMYLVGIGGAWFLASRRLHAFDPTWSKEKLSDLVFWVAMGVIVGGRLGYVLFYDLPAYIANPLLILETLTAVDAMLDGLGERTRRIFLAVQLQGLSYVATGERLGVSVTTVKKHMIRAMTHCLLLMED